MPIDGVRMGDWVCEVDFGVDTAIYASGDLLANTEELPYAVMSNGTSVITSLTLTDGDDQGAAMDVLFFRSNPGSLGVRNAAISITQTQAEECLGWVPIGAADYCDLGTRRVATVRSVGLVVHPTNSTSVWVALVSRGTPTYTTGRLLLKVGLLRG